MSAYVCNPTHIALLAVRTASWSTRWGDAKSVATILAKENLRSVEARYNDVAEAAQDFLSMSNDEYIAECVALTQDPNVEFHTLPPHRIFGMAACTIYQSCEAGDFYTTDAFDILNMLQLKAARVSFEQKGLEPGWDFDESELPRCNVQSILRLR